jgi:hypothetical protein
MDAHKVNAADLTAEQVETIEDELGIPVTEWGSRGSVVRTMRRVLEMGNGVASGAYSSMTARKMAELVSLDDDSDADPNP